MSLRGEPVEVDATLPDGRALVVRVGVPEDSYVPKAERATVDLGLFADGRALASVSTVLDPGRTSEARELAREVASALERGEIEPTAGALERYADDERLLPRE